MIYSVMLREFVSSLLAAAVFEMSFVTLVSSLFVIVVLYSRGVAGQEKTAVRTRYGCGC